MFKLAKCLAVVMLIALFATAALAQPTPTATTTTTTTGAAAAPGFSMNLGAAFGAGLVILGAGMGIGRIGSAAVEGMSRQPEVAAKIQTAMIISAALIEGATFFGLIVCMLFNT